LDSLARGTAARKPWQGMRQSLSRNREPTGAASALPIKP
jgi:hypothetical protein